MNAREEAVQALAEAAEFALDETNEYQSPWWYRLDSALARYKAHLATLSPEAPSPGAEEETP